MTHWCKHDLKILLHGSLPLKLFFGRYVSEYNQNLLPNSLKHVLACAIILVLFVIIILIDDVIDVFSRIEILDFDRPHVN
jgi:hypothetical protein